MEEIPIRRALLSVSDKEGLAELGKTLAELGVELVSTGGTAHALREAGLDVRDVSDLTGFPEMMDGRVKTLHPKVHGGLLAKRDDAVHQDAAARHGIDMIDLLVVNLYPFEATAAKGAPRADIIENIDIGGPAMIRSAAKNHAGVAVVTDPADYAALVEELGADGTTGSAFRTRMAAKAFAHTAAYDAAIANWLAFGDAFANPLGAQALQASPFPAIMPLAFTRADTLRYGENPHQQAAVYVPQVAGAPGVPQARQLQGKALSYNNLNDADAALELAAEFADGDPAVVIVKHANPCGVAQADTLAKAWEAALACDSVSAFGGIVAVNTELDAATAERIAAIFTEVVIAPAISAEARAVFAKKKNLRLLECGALPNPRRGGFAMKTIAGGLLVQGRDDGAVSRDDLKVVTKRQPTERELQDCLFAWTVARHVKSNAIVYAKDSATAGIGAGQMNRRDSARIAAIKAREAAEKEGWGEPRTVGSAVASDAFFPFADGLVAAAEAGATAIIQPGGSIRDEEVIAAADERGLAMIFTGMRHFRH